MNLRRNCTALAAVAGLIALSFGVVQVVAQTNPGQTDPNRQPGQQQPDQSQPGQKQPGTPTGGLTDAQRSAQADAGRAVTLNGTLIDLHCFMTGKDSKHTSVTDTHRPSAPGTPNQPGTTGQPKTTDQRGATDQPGRPQGTPGAPTDPDQPPAGQKAGQDASAGYTRGDNKSECAECIRRGAACALDSNMGLVVLGKGETGTAELAPHAGKQITVRGRLFEKSGLKYLEIQSVEPQVALGNQPRTTPR